VLVEPVDDTRPVTVERITAAVVAGVRFIVLDPLSLFIADHLGDGDERGDLKVRAAMRPIITLAQRHGAAIVGIKHTNKGEGRAILNRVAGSRAYTAAARALLFVADDPDATDPLNPDRLIFPRGNLTTNTAALRYRIEGVALALDDGEVRQHPRIVWKGESGRSAEEAFARTDRGPVDDRPKRPPTPDSAVGYAMGWLTDVLDGRGEVPAADVLDMADDEKLARRTVQRAAHELGVQRRRDGFGKGAAWFWTLPDGINDRHIDATSLPTCHVCVGDGTQASMSATLDDELFAGAVDVTPEDNR
jgi:putative DNA primase/helicase